MTDKSQPPATRRRWFRFSLRMLLVVVTVLCVWLAFKVNAARRQKLAVEAILRAGGTVWFDYHNVPVPGVPNSKFNRDAAPPGPAWLREVIGQDYFRTADCVDFIDRAIKQSDLAQVAQLPELICVNLNSTKIVDGTGHMRPIADYDLVFLERLTKLHDLVLSNYTGMGLVTDAGLERVQNFADLDELYLRNNKISDAGLRYLTGLKKLKTLDLEGTQVTPLGIRDLRKALPNCWISYR